MRTTKRRQSAIEKALLEMPAEDSREFLRMASFNAPYQDLQEFLKERGIEVPITLIARWFRYNAPSGSQAIIIEELSAEWQNLNPTKAMRLIAGINLKLILRLNESINPQIEEASPATKLTNLVELLKEQRQLLTELKIQQLNLDTEGVYLSGMINLKDETLGLLKDSPSKDIVESALTTALEKIRQNMTQP